MSLSSSDFGPVPGLNVNLPLISTRAIGRNPEAWRDMLYGPGKYIDAPDRSFGVSEKQLAAYLKLNIDVPVTDFVTLHGNMGVRIVKTDLEVRQNLTDPFRLRQDVLAGVDPNHTAYIDLGDKSTDTDRTRALPSINLNLDFGQDWRIKAAYHETQALQPLENLGRGEVRFFRVEDTAAGETSQRVDSVQRLGNPKLEPWFARTFSGAIEWYPRKDAVVSVGAFRTEVESYTFNRSSQIAAADSDGVVRRGATLLEIANGEGASYYGFELGYQQTFDFLPGLLANTGATVNYTYTPSQAGIDPGTGETIRLADGSEAPFNNTAENQFNVVLWYQDDAFQFRVAANYLSEQYQGAFTHWSFSSPSGTAGLGQFQESTLYIDVGASYDFNENIQFFLQGQNLTEEAPVIYTGWSDNRTSWNQFERVVTAGVRMRF